MYDVLYARVAMDIHFLNTMMGADTGVGKAEFTGIFWRGWKNIREHDVVRVSLRFLSYFVWGLLTARRVAAPRSI
jgi:hypothetical protein